MHKLKWLLAASLLLNLFFIGGLIGGAYKILNIGAKGENALRFAADNLSLAQKQSFKKTIQEARRTALPLLQISAQARTDAINQIAMPNFNKTATQVAFAKAYEADKAVRIHIETAILNYVEKLSPADRATFSVGLSKSGPLRPPQMLLRDKIED